MHFGRVKLTSAENSAPNEAVQFTKLAGNVGQTIGAQVHFFPTVGSTMDIARDFAAKSAPVGTVIIADHQTKGRGRKGRIWQDAPAADLALSVILRPTAQSAELLFIMAALAIADCITATLPPPVRLRKKFKWPNDVLIANRKIAGVIVETTQSGPAHLATGTDEVPTNLIAIVGIGLNVNMDSTHALIRTQSATSLRLINGGDRLARADVLEKLLRALDKWHTALQNGKNIVPNWSKHLIDIGKAVEVVRDGDLVHFGKVAGVDDLGRLLIRNAESEVFTATAEEVHIIR